jgi:hypothetical protein
MIRHIPNTQINKVLWDGCIGRSPSRRVYAYSWYLDLVCPGWDALVEDDYDTVFPLTHRRKWGVTYAFQPFFAQQLGVFGQEIPSPEKVHEFIRAIPAEYRLADIHLNAGNHYSGDPGIVTMRSNYELAIGATHELTMAGYAQNTRRNIKKCLENGVSFGKIENPDHLINLFRENYGRQEGKLKESNYAVLKQLISHCLDRDLGYISGAFSREGALCAGAFFLFDRERCYFLFAASAPGARDNGAMFGLVDRFLAEHAGKGLVLDFEGGNDPNLGRFYRGFGAREVPYPALRISRLGKLAEKGLYFVRKFRK